MGNDNLKHEQQCAIHVVSHSNMFVGMRVKDNEGNVGSIIDCKDIHNVYVEYDNGGSGFHCLVEGCVEKTTIDDMEIDIPHYDPLYYCG